MRLAVIDGQGGGIGTTIIKKLKEAYGEKIEVWALGTNAIATAQMMKSGANRGATGENAIRHCAGQVAVIAGPISIMVAHAMMGEVTPKMAEAIAASPAKKYLIPLSQENIEIVGAASVPLPHLINELIEKHLRDINIQP